MTPRRDTKTASEATAGSLNSAKWRREFKKASRVNRARLISSLLDVATNAPDATLTCAELALIGLSDRDVDIVRHAIGTVGGLLATYRIARDGLEFRTVARPAHFLPVVRRAAPLLAAASRSAWPDSRANAYHALGALGLATRATMSALKRGSRDPEPFCRGHAVAALGVLGELPVDVVTSIAQIAANAAETEQVRVFAVSALGRQRRHGVIGRRVLSQLVGSKRIGSRLRLFSRRALEQLDSGTEQDTRP